MGVVYTLPLDPIYTHQYPIYHDEDPYYEDIAALELTGRNVAKSRSLKITHELVKISSMAFTKPKFETYIYNVNNAHEILEELISHNLIKNDFGPYPKPEQLKGKKYCNFHNIWNHN